MQNGTKRGERVRHGPILVLVKQRRASDARIEATKFIAPAIRESQQSIRKEELFFADDFDHDIIADGDAFADPAAQDQHRRGLAEKIEQARSNELRGRLERGLERALPSCEKPVRVISVIMREQVLR